MRTAITSRRYELINTIIEHLKDLYQSAKNTNETHALLQSCITSANLIKSTIISNGTSEEVEKNRGRLDKDFTDLAEIIKSSTQFSQEEKHKSELIKETIKKLERKTAASVLKKKKIIDEYRSDSIEKRLKTVQEKISKSDEAIESLGELIKDPLKEAEKTLEETKQRLGEKEEKLNEIFGTVTAESISGSYENTATKENDTANKLRNYSIVFMTLMVLMICYTYYQSSYQQFDIAQSIIRIGMVVILSIPATYLAKESSRHREIQNKYKQNSLHLKAIHPYIASLPQEKQNEIKEKVAEQIFVTESRKVYSEPEAQLVVTRLLRKLENGLNNS